MTDARMHLHGFTMVSPAPHSLGIWTHPLDEQGTRYADIGYWKELARLLERGGFDSLFIADILAAYDVYEGSMASGVRNAVQIPANSPMLPITAMADATRDLGFAITYSTTYTRPYLAARHFSTLDHFTDGRIAWNIVTSYLENEAANFGMVGEVSHDERYDRADEYLEVCYKLWEGSWEDDAVVVDRDAGVYSRPEKVHRIDHEGEYFDVRGPHICAPSPQRTPVIYQAGSSERGREFAAKHAEAVFTIQPNVEEARRYVDDIRERAVEYDRNPEDIAVSAKALPIVGTTEERAEEKYEEYLDHIDYDGALTMLSGHLGIDLSRYDPGDHLEATSSDAIQGLLEMYTKLDATKDWTIGDIAYSGGLGGNGPIHVGTPEQIADELERWMAEANVDGFVISQAIAPGTLRDFVQLVVPELRERGLVETESGGDTLRENLLGTGSSRLPETHPGRRYSRD